MTDRLARTLDFIKKKNKLGRSRWVYFIKCGDFYKVGIADNVKSRIHNLQCATPYPIELVKAWQCMDAASQERTIHNLLGRFHERGEWFKLPIDVVLSFGSCAASPIDALRVVLKSSRPRE